MTGHVTGDARKRYEVETVDPRAALVEPPAVVRTYVGRDESGLSWMVETMGDVVRIATRRDDWDRWSEPIEPGRGPRLQAQRPHPRRRVCRLRRGGGPMSGPEWTVGVVAQTTSGEVILKMTEAQADELRDSLVWLTGGDTDD